jgi:hypothetical protein
MRPQNRTPSKQILNWRGFRPCGQLRACASAVPSLALMVMRWPLACLFVVACGAGDPPETSEGAGGEPVASAAGEAGEASVVAGRASGGQPTEPEPAPGGAGSESAEGGVGGEGGDSGAPPGAGVGGEPPISCEPKTKEQACGNTTHCGEVDDGCSSTVSCGTCALAKECLGGRCLCPVRPSTPSNGCTNVCKDQAPKGCGFAYLDYPDACGLMKNGDNQVCNSYTCTDDKTGEEWTCGNGS